MVRYIKSLLAYFEWWGVVSKMNGKRVVEDWNTFDRAYPDKHREVCFTTYERYKKCREFDEAFEAYLRDSDEKDEAFLKLKRVKWAELFGETNV